ncbi:MAG: type III-A CRISPR-associated protein Csm2 [Dethiobacter sp.]
MQDRGSPFLPRGGGEPPRLPSGYLQGGYFQPDGKNLRPEVIVGWAEEVARALGDARAKMTYTQLWQFYKKTLSIKQKLEVSGAFPDLVPELLTLKRDAAYSVGKGNAPELFKVFIDRNVDLAVKGEVAFTKGFLQHFQSVVAFKRYWEYKKGERR